MIDAHGLATILSCEAEADQASGNKGMAREKHFEAGRILEREAGLSGNNQEKHLAWLLAATQFYHGGDYEKASSLAKKIRAVYLGRFAGILPVFLKDVAAKLAESKTG